jgi:hypothetical protein
MRFVRRDRGSRTCPSFGDHDVPSRRGVLEGTKRPKQGLRPVAVLARRRRDSRLRRSARRGFARQDTGSRLLGRAAALQGSSLIREHLPPQRSSGPALLLCQVWARFESVEGNVTRARSRLSSALVGLGLLATYLFDTGHGAEEALAHNAPLAGQLALRAAIMVSENRPS